MRIIKSSGRKLNNNNKGKSSSASVRDSTNENSSDASFDSKTKKYTNK